MDVKPFIIILMTKKQKQPEITIEYPNQLQRIEPQESNVQQTDILQLPVPSSFPTAYQSAIKSYNKWLDGRHVTIDSIIEYLKEKQQTQKPATIATKKFALKRAVKEVMSHGARKVDIALLDTEFKKVKVGKPDPRVYAHRLISQEDLEIIYQKAKPRTGLIIKTLALTGMRISELTSIKVKDCKISGDMTYIVILGKGSKEREIFIKTSLLHEIKKVFNGRVWLFENRKGGMSNRVVLWKNINDAGRLVGRDDVHPHMMRHFFGSSTLIEKKMSIKAVSQYLGHANCNVTLDTYVHDQLKPEDLFG